MENMVKTMKVLVLGIDGYIGTRLAQTLMKRGHDIVGVDTGFYREGWLYNGIEQMPRIINKDTRELTEEDLKGYDAVIHLADLSNDPLGQQDPELTYDINHKASVRVATLAKKVGVRRFIQGVEDLKKVFETIKMTEEVFNFRAYTRINELVHLKETGQIDKKLFFVK